MSLSLPAFLVLPYLALLLISLPKSTTVRLTGAAIKRHVMHNKHLFCLNVVQGEQNIES